MAVLKIISNPYEQKTTFQYLDNHTNEWINLEVDNPNSGLLSSKIIGGFFPFVAADILDIIVKEYKSSDIISLFFEGTDNEYQDLQEICNECPYKEYISLSRTPKYLSNAKDILPEIVKIFQKVTPLVHKSIDTSKIQKKMNQFSDASNDIIPICVLGNYSSGKSAFINALIGHEILPSGNEPVTAKIYQIERSDRNDQATVSFEIDSEPVKISIEEKRNRFESGRIENELVRELMDILDDNEKESIYIRLNLVLSAVNKYEKRHKDSGMSDLIEITLPITSGWMTESTHKFVIFDTPGSNSASNEEHSMVLRKVMEDLSNGIPIFVSEIDRLDTIDSKELYEEIKSMDGFDTRFTLIVISKADSANLVNYEKYNEEEIETILNQAVPRNMYSEGIFFVSSILGLGAKNDGEFIDEHSAEVFDEKREKFTNKGSRFYKQLYKYNIMPSQLKARSLTEADHYANTLFANSGLFSLEEEIKTFADKYSAYNKCKQSQLFLDKVINITSDEINKNKETTNENLEILQSDYNSKESELIDTIDNQCDELVNWYVTEFDNNTLECLQGCINGAQKDDFKSLEQQFIEIQKILHNYQGIVDEKNIVLKELGDNFLKNLKNAFSNKNSESIRKTLSELVSDLKRSRDENKITVELENQIAQAAADDLVRQVNNDYTESIKKAYDAIFGISKEYWENSMDELKEKLLGQVTESAELSDNEKLLLENAITSFENINLENNPDEKFSKEDFEYSIFEKMFASPTDNLNLEKLKKNYNSEISANINAFYQQLSEEHKQKFSHWADVLKNTIYVHLTELNPRLAGKYKNIMKGVKDLQDLEERELKLKQYAKEIFEKIDWIDSSK